MSSLSPVPARDSSLPPVPAKKDLSRLYTQIRSFHTTYILQLFQQRQERYSRQNTFTLDKIGTNDITCCDILLSHGSPTKFKNRIKRDKTRRTKEFRQTRRSSAFMYKPRQNKFSKLYHNLVETLWYKILSVILALLALYSRDIVFAFLPQFIDFIILDIGLSFIFIFLFIEWILYSISHYNYFLTFFFWLDIIGTISIIFDIPYITHNLFYDNYNNSKLINNNQRFFQLLKMARMLKLFRLVHLFKQSSRSEIGEYQIDAVLRNLGSSSSMNTINSPKHMKNTIINSTKKQRKSDEDIFSSDTENNILRPTRQGTLIGDSLIQKLMLGVLCKFFMMPLFDVGDIDFNSTTKYELENITTFYTIHQIDIDINENIEYLSDYQHIINRYKQYNQNAIYLQIISNNNQNLQRNEINDNDKINKLRNIEKLYIYNNDDISSSMTILNIKKSVQIESLLNIGLITTIMFIFFIGSTFIKYDFANSLIAPQRYLLKTIDVLTKIIFKNLKKKIDFKRDAFMRTVMSTNTDIFFSHQHQQEFLTQLRNSEIDSDDDEEEQSVSLNFNGNKQQSMDIESSVITDIPKKKNNNDNVNCMHGIEIDIDNDEKFNKQYINLQASSSDMLNNSSSSELLQRYLGNSRPSLEIESNDECSDNTIDEDECIMNANAIRMNEL